MSVMNFILFTGGFDPVHSGHLNAMKAAANLGYLIVAPNSNDWLIRKKGAFFQPLQERVAILRNFSFITDIMVDWDDSDGTAVHAIKKFYEIYQDKNRQLLFANGGDRVPGNLGNREVDVCLELGIMPIFNVGGGKTQSSSSLLHKWSRRI
jgi:cytidyltransferase-like protein